MLQPEKHCFPIISTTVSIDREGSITEKSGCKPVTVQRIKDGGYKFHDVILKEKI